MVKSHCLTPQDLDVSPEDIVVQTGCGAILSNMFQLLCEPGESVLIPAPYYPAFENDLKVRCIMSIGSVVLGRMRQQCLLLLSWRTRGVGQYANQHAFQEERRLIWTPEAMPMLCAGM